MNALSDRWHPTCKLRCLEGRTEPSPVVIIQGQPVTFPLNKPVLQQLWQNHCSGATEWRDVEVIHVHDLMMAEMPRQDHGLRLVPHHERIPARCTDCGDVIPDGKPSCPTCFRMPSWPGPRDVQPPCDVEPASDPLGR